MPQSRQLTESTGGGLYMPQSEAGIQPLIFLRCECQSALLFGGSIVNITEAMKHGTPPF
uniref:Uncharacterized protein n=1 Tax=Aegilops tauschii subsp. strangulata TaxID=200361 RepID=A0A453QEX9_AEGTS